MAKLFFGVIILFLLSGCNLFRKKSENIHFSAGRDSSWSLESGTAMKNGIQVKNKSGTVNLQVRGFDKVSISKDGKITAEGKDGELIYGSEQSSNDSSLTSESSSNALNTGSVRDSSSFDKDLDVETSGEVDSWLSWWLIVGMCVIAMFVIVFAFDINLGLVWKAFKKYLKI